MKAYCHEDSNNLQPDEYATNWRFWQWVAYMSEGRRDEEMNQYFEELRCRQNPIN